MKIRELRRRVQELRESMKRGRRRRRGMNLIEVVIVIAIILILIGALGAGAYLIFGKSQVSAAKIEMKGLETIVTTEIFDVLHDVLHDGDRHQ